MTDLITAVEAVAASSGRGLDVVPTPAHSPAAMTQSGAPDRAAGATDPEALKQALGEVAERLRGSDVDLNYRVDPELRRVIVEVVDRRDGTVLRQIPGEEALRLARLMDSGHGGLLHTTA